MAETCMGCGQAINETEGLLLVRGRVREKHCSESCLRETVRKRRTARFRAQLRWFLRLAVIVLLPAGAKVLWHRTRAPQPEVIVSGPPEAVLEEAPSEPTQFGPAWPPTDADWIAAFSATSWIYPLPGPVRRMPIVDGRIFGPDAPPTHPAHCRKDGHCGVDLGGELWGEHVYAVHDGIVDRVQNAGNEEHGGHYVRLSHFGGMVFTQYFHLAAVPRGLVRGVHVKAGEVIGLVGDTGTLGKGSPRHLHFALSIRPSAAFSEVYWDPEPWMADWPLRLPTHGTVAGLASAEKEGEMSQRRRRSK